jgi:hypothetical protein
MVPVYLAGVGLYADSRAAMLCLQSVSQIPNLAMALQQSYGIFALTFLVPNVFEVLYFYIYFFGSILWYAFHLLLQTHRKHPAHLYTNINNSILCRFPDVPSINAYQSLSADQIMKEEHPPF